MARGAPAPLWVYGAFAAAFGGAVWAGSIADKRRTAAMRSVAQTMGFEFMEDGELGALGEHAGALPVLCRGHSRTFSRVLIGKLGEREARLFDYRYTTGSGRSQSTHRQTIAFFPDGGKGLPPFELSPESIFHAVAEMFGAQDINFEQNADFSKHYLLKSNDEGAVRKAFNDQVLAYFAGAPGWRVQCAEGTLAVFKEGSFVKPEQVPAFAAEALRILGLLGN